MPRDAADTRVRLLDAGQALFARQGAFQTPLKQVVDAAGQRNTSALHYHFGGRRGLLDAIIERHNEAIEDERRVLLDRLEAEGRDDLRALVTALVVPFARQLGTPGGREFLSIVSQLVDLFDRWDEDEQRTPAEALRNLRAIAARLPAGLSPELRHERVARLLGLVTEALGARARQIDSGGGVRLDHDTFVANLVDMGTGAVGAPAAAAPGRAAD